MGTRAGPGGCSTAILLASVLYGPFIHPGVLTSQRLGGLRRLDKAGTVSSLTRVLSSGTSRWGISWEADSLMPASFMVSADLCGALYLPDTAPYKLSPMGPYGHLPTWGLVSRASRQGPQLVLWRHLRCSWPVLSLSPGPDKSSKPIGTDTSVLGDFIPLEAARNLTRSQLPQEA